METLTPVPTPAGGNQGTAYYSVVFTVYNDAHNSIDANDHVSEALGETVYTQDYSGLAAGTLTPRDCRKRSWARSRETWVI